MQKCQPESSCNELNNCPNAMEINRMQWQTFKCNENKGVHYANAWCQKLVHDNNPTTNCWSNESDLCLNLLSSDPYHNTKALYQEHTHQNPVLDLLKPTATVVTAHSSEPDRGLRKGISSSEVSFFQLSVSLHIHNSNITGSVLFHFVTSNPNSTAILVQFSPSHTSIPYLHLLPLSTMKENTTLNGRNPNHLWHVSLNNICSQDLS